MSAELPEKYRPLWDALEQVLLAFDEIQNRLHPPRIPESADRLKPPAEALEKALAEAKSVREESGATDGDATGDVLFRAAARIAQAAEKFEYARTGPHEILKAFQSLRPLTKGKEILYELAARVPEVGRYFTDPMRHEDDTLRARLDRAGTIPASEPERGLLHFENQAGKRGGYSLYVPEYYDHEKKWPLVVALHGGSGHGADFLWNWLPAARAYGFILLAPTSRDRTWSLRNPGMDAANLNKMLATVSETWNINTERLLLTGISDGGTYSMLLSVVHQAPFTHYAPVAAAVHVLMDKEGVVRAPVAEKKIYQVHGALDWMFPVAGAREAAEALKKAGAQVTYREIADLSHNYPRDENPRIVEWFCPDLSAD